MPTRLRSLGDGTPGGEIIQQFRKIFRCQVFIIIIVDLHHRRIATGTQAFHLQPREIAIRADNPLLANLLAANFLDRFRATQGARRRATKLHEMLAHRLQIEHGIKGGNFHHPDHRHVQHGRDLFNRRLRQPIGVLRLRPPQQRNHRRSLSSIGIFGNLRLGPDFIFPREGERGGLDGSKAADGHFLAFRAVFRCF